MAGALAAAVPAQAAVQGVTGEEIVVGTHLDLSGPLSTWGTALRNGMRMAFDEANEAGGIGGRNLRLVAANDAYDPDMALRAVRTLHEEDRVFAILSPMGTPTVLAAMPYVLENRILYLFPLTPSEQIYQPPQPLLFGLTPGHAESVAGGLRQLLDMQNVPKVAVLVSDDAFGHQVRTGAVDELRRRGLSLGASATFPRRTASFAAVLTQLREMDIEIIVLGTIGQETLDVLHAAEAMRWRPIFLCSSACYTPELAIMGGRALEGLYAIGHVPIPYPDDPAFRDWARHYEIQFEMIPTAHALAGYRNARLFLAALERAGRVPTAHSVAYALESIGPWNDDYDPGPPIDFTVGDHLGRHEGFLAQVRNGRWTVVRRENPTRL